jgi:hypothetical protein
MGTLRVLRQAYASVRVAVYEPLLLEWMSASGLIQLLVHVVERPISKRGGLVPGGAAAPTLHRFDWRSAVTRGGRASDLQVAPSARATTLSKDEVERRTRFLVEVLSKPGLTFPELDQVLLEADVPQFGDSGGLRHVLSPVGVAHLYRQLYFDVGAGLGPIEHAFCVAPREELQIVQETTRREAVETLEQFGSEQTLEKASEQTVVEEISDLVQQTLRRDMQVGIAASTEGTIGVWSASASASVDLASSSERARETATKRSVSQTAKSSETIRKTYGFSVRNSSEIVERSTMRRTVRNESDVPVNYGLRRVLRQVRVKLQSLGPRLVWTLYVNRPGDRLATSKLVMFRESTASAVGDVPGAPPKPQGGSEAGSLTVPVDTSSNPDIIVLKLNKDPARDYAPPIVESIVDASPGKDASPPSVIGPESQAEDPDVISYRIQVKAGSARTVNVSFTRNYQPSTAVIQEWIAQVAAARAAYEAARAEEELERAKRLIVAKSRVRPRPANELRDEERYELMNRLVSEAFHDAGPSSLPSPAEIEIFHRYFEVNALFYFIHPSWWRPRYGTARADYELTEDSEPARFGKSLGWLLQLDGDRRRNEFLNSPWVRVCLPVRPGLETEALAWLATHIEGQRGFSLDAGTPVSRLLQEIADRRTAEQAASPGPDYVTYDGTVPPGREDAATAYPVVDEFEVTVPTEGFVYESLDVVVE